MKREITADDVTQEANRNYDLGRKHAQEELHPAIKALNDLYTSCGNLSLRIKTSAPQLTKFSDWDENAKAMQQAENALPTKLSAPVA